MALYYIDYQPGTYYVLTYVQNILMLQRTECNNVVAVLEALTSTSNVK